MQNGKFILCHQCGSDSHFIRDFLETNTPAFVYYAFYNTDEYVFDLINKDTLDLIKDLQDSEWEVLLDSVSRDTTNQEPCEVEHDLSEFLFAIPADYSELHRLYLKTKDLASAYDQYGDNSLFLTNSF